MTIEEEIKTKNKEMYLDKLKEDLINNTDTLNKTVSNMIDINYFKNNKDKESKEKFKLEIKEILDNRKRNIEEILNKKKEFTKVTGLKEVSNKFKKEVMNLDLEELDKKIGLMIINEEKIRTTSLNNLFLSSYKHIKKINKEIDKK